MGAEPTMREDLPDIIRMVRRTGNIAALHTNGIKIADLAYLKELKNAGLNEVHLQFDGFDDLVYERIRGKRLLQVKLKALENLGKLNVSTDLKATVVRGINECQMAEILEFGVKHAFVKEIFFLGCRYLGRAKDLSMDGCIMPDELIDALESQTNGRISRENILRFQKLYFVLLAALSKRKCFYVQHFLITRNKNGYQPINEIFNLKSIEPVLDKLKDLRPSKLSLAYLLFCLIPNLAGLKGLRQIKGLLPMFLSFIRGFDLSKLSGKNILLGFISACDAYSFDYQVTRNCGKGAVSVELGIQDIGALDNVIRDYKDKAIEPFVRGDNEDSRTCQ